VNFSSSPERQATVLLAPGLSALVSSGNRSFRDIETEHEQFAVNTGLPQVEFSATMRKIRSRTWKSFSGPQ